jgi:hypothetical protein
MPARPKTCTPLNTRLLATGDIPYFVQVRQWLLVVEAPTHEAQGHAHRRL